MNLISIGALAAALALGGCAHGGMSGSMHEHHAGRMGHGAGMRACPPAGADANAHQNGAEHQHDATQADCPPPAR